jgi:hypothetical protein
MPSQLVADEVTRRGAGRVEASLEVTYALLPSASWRQ